MMVSGPGQRSVSDICEPRYDSGARNTSCARITPASATTNAFTGCAEVSSRRFPRRDRRRTARARAGPRTIGKSLTSADSSAVAAA